MKSKAIDKTEVKWNQIETFRNELFGEIRTVVLNEKVYFVGKDIAEKLGYARPTKAIQDNCKGVLKWDIPTNGGKQELSVIPESDVYRLIIKSKLPAAEKFEKWVTEEVLPSIRQTGGYIPHNKEDDDATIMAKALLISQKTIERKNEQLKASEEENLKLVGIIDNQKPKLDYLDEILNCDDALLVTSIAFDYGITAQALNKILCEERIQRKVRDQYILYSDYLGKGYTKTETKMICDKPRIQTLWTQKGRMLVHEILNKRQIKALMDLELAQA